MAAPMTRTVNVCKHCGRFIALSSPLITFTRFNNHALRYTSTQTAPNPDTTSGQPKSKPGPWMPVIGLEIHAQIEASSKLFSGASSLYGGAVNTQVAFLDTALPGTLPVINMKCVEAGVLTALALQCDINRVSKFDRKHYFYADLPAGYQITQQRQPIARGGQVNYIVKNPKSKKAMHKTARITQLQLEQDSGKSLHDEENRLSLIDLNRAGCALMEIVTEPDFTSSRDATSFVTELRHILQAIGTCNGKMSEGSLRVDANISVHKKGQPLGIRTEVKNLNSIRMVGRAIEAEIHRQKNILDEGGEVFNETRSFDVPSGLTLPMRDKEMKQDYRFMPEPNLPPLHLYTSDTVPDSHVQDDVVLIDKVKRKMPILPSEIRQTIVEKYAISMYYAAVLMNDGLLPYFDALIEGREQVKLFNFIVHIFLPLCNARDIDVEDCPVTPEDVGVLFDMYTNLQLCKNLAVKVMEKMLDNPGTGDTPVDIVNCENWWQINDMPFLTDLCQKLIDAHPNIVRKYKSGKDRFVLALIGKAMEETGQRANPVFVSQILKELMSD